MRPDDSTDDTHKLEAQELTPVDEGRRYVINAPDVKVTIDYYTPFQAHVISLLKSIDAKLKRIQDGNG